MNNMENFVAAMVTSATAPTAEIVSMAMKATHIYVVNSIYEECPAVFKYVKTDNIDFVNDSDALKNGRIILVGKVNPDWVEEEWPHQEDCLPMGIGDLVVEGDRIYRVEKKEITIWPQ